MQQQTLFLLLSVLFCVTACEGASEPSNHIDRARRYTLSSFEKLGKTALSEVEKRIKIKVAT